MRAPDLERTSGGLTVRLYLTPLRAPRSATVEVSHYGAPLDTLTLAPSDGLEAYRHPSLYSDAVRGFLTGAPIPDDTPTDLAARVAAYGQTTPLTREGDVNLYYVKTGLEGYGPELDTDDEPVPLAELDGVLAEELDRAADFASDSARALADDGDFEAAWREHERAEDLSARAANFNPERRKAPLYADDEAAWLRTVETMLADFPLDIGNHERLYVWTAEGD